MILVSMGSWRIPNFKTKINILIRSYKKKHLIFNNLIKIYILTFYNFNIRNIFSLEKAFISKDTN